MKKKFKIGENLAKLQTKCRSVLLCVLVACTVGLFSDRVDQCQRVVVVAKFTYKVAQTTQNVSSQLDTHMLDVAETTDIQHIGWQWCNLSMLAVFRHHVIDTGTGASTACFQLQRFIWCHNWAMGDASVPIQKLLKPKNLKKHFQIPWFFNPA